MPVNSFENYPMSWKPDLSQSEGPKYKVLANLLEKDIMDGTLKAGTKLPPQRELADFLDVNLSTISRAFKLCEQRGLICASVGNGTYVSADATAGSILLSPDDNTQIKMGAIIPSLEYNKYIDDYLQKMLNSATSYQLFTYNTPSGSKTQQEAGVKWLAQAGLSTDTSHLQYAAGGQNSLTAALASLCKTGDRIGTDELTYPGLKSAAKLLGIQLIPIQSSNGEMTEEGILYALKNEKIKGLYIIPDYQNPTAHTMTLTTRKMISSLAKSESFFVIEDAINSRLAEYPLPPVTFFAPEQCIYLASLSKAVAPGLRVAYLHVPLALHNQVSESLYAMNIALSPLTSELAAHFILDGNAEQVIALRKKDIYDRNVILNDILKDYPLSGDLHSPLRFLYLPDYFTGKSFEICAKEVGVHIYGAERFAVGTASPVNAIRISVTSPSTIDELREGALRIRKLLQNDDETSYID